MLFSASVRSQLQYCVQLFRPTCLEGGRGSEGLGDWSPCEGRLNFLGMFSLQKGLLRCGMIAFFKYVHTCCIVDGELKNLVKNLWSGGKLEKEMYTTCLPVSFSLSPHCPPTHLPLHSGLPWIGLSQSRVICSNLNLICSNPKLAWIRLICFII